MCGEGRSGDASQSLPGHGRGWLRQGQAAVSQIAPIADFKILLFVLGFFKSSHVWYHWKVILVLIWVSSPQAANYGDLNRKVAKFIKT